jgi:hypothetical protein
MRGEGEGAMRWMSSLILVLALAPAARAQTGAASLTPPPSACAVVVPSGAVVGADRVVRDRSGNVLSVGTTCAAPGAALSQAGSASATFPDPKGPYEEFALSYLDETAAAMWSGVIASVQLPPQGPRFVSDQSFRWSSRIYGRAKSTSDQDQILQASVGFGAWPTAPGTLQGRYTTWLTIQNGTDTSFMTQPVPVLDNSTVEFIIRMTGIRQPNPPVETPDVALYDPYSYLLWELDVAVDNTVVATLSGSTLSLGRMEFSAVLPAIMGIYNVPGVNAPTCADALPPIGNVVFGPNLVATADVHTPTNLVWGAPSLVPFTNVPGGAPGLQCDPWGTDNVIVVSPSTVLLTWPTASTSAAPPPPPIVPAVGPVGVVVLASFLVVVGRLVINGRRLT